MSTEKEAPALAEIHWEGNSREVLASFPEEIRANLGFALYELQRGGQPPVVTRRMESIGPGVYELKESDERTWYRAIYLSKIGNVIYILHCFKKQTRKTDKRDLQVARERLSRLDEELRSRGKMRNITENKATHVTQGNVFQDLGFSPEKALALKFKARILAGILDEVKRKKYRQAQLVKILHEHQPVVSNLLRGKIAQMSIEKLLIYADRLGLSLDVQKQRNPSRRRRAA